MKILYEDDTTIIMLKDKEAPVKTITSKPKRKYSKRKTKESN